VGFDVLTTCQPSTVWCSRERLPAATAQPAQGSSEPVAPRIIIIITHYYSFRVHDKFERKKSRNIVVGCFFLSLRDRGLGNLGFNGVS
jgi:hypothetical protein